MWSCGEAVADPVRVRGQSRFGGRCRDKRRMLLLLVVIGCAVSTARAQGQFQAPTPDELKMTEEPKAPGAAAIYLYREETVDDNLHFHSFYARIKVLTEKGKELATVGVPYPKGKFQITDIKARTIHPDGTIIPLDVKPADLLMALNTRGNGARLNKMVFTLPSVEVGSILEYRWQLRYDDVLLSSPNWDVQQPYFVRRAHYSFLPYRFRDRVIDGKGNSASRLLYTTMLPPGVKVIEDATGKFLLDVSDVPPIPHEDYMPPLASVIEKVVFYYTSYLDKDDFWKHEGNNWSKEMDHFAGESNTLRSAVSQIVAPADSEDAKAHKLYDAVLTLENTDYTRRKSQVEMKEEGVKQIRSAEDVWNQKSGSGDEIALLYLAMARIAGLKAYAVTVCNRNREVLNPFYLSLSQFNDVLVMVTVGGKEIPVDPGQKYAPFGQLGWMHAMTEGLRQSDKGVEFAQIPANPYKAATMVRFADVYIAKDGTVSGTIRISMTGPAALRWRHRALQSDEDEIKKQFNEYLHTLVPDGVDAEFDHFLGLEDYHEVLMGMAKLSGNMGTVTGKRLFLPGTFFETHPRRGFVSEEKRETPIDMEYGSTETDEATYHVPDGFSIESAPPDTTIPWSGHAAFQLKSVVDPANKDRVQVVRSLARAFAMLAAKDYPELREFYQKVAAAEQQPLVLKAAAAASGSE